MNRLQGRPVIVTGGGSGIGRGACLRIAEEGARVTVADIRLGIAEETAELVRGAGSEAIAVQCDVADEEQVAETVARPVSEFGSLWGLVANAGTAGRGWIHETDLADWQSIAGSVIGPGGSNASYAASKHGLIGLAKQIAVDYGSYHIRANAIQPSGVDGSNFRKHAGEDRKRMKTPRTELPNFGTPPAAVGTRPGIQNPRVETRSSQLRPTAAAPPRTCPLATQVRSRAGASTAESQSAMDPLQTSRPSPSKLGDTTKQRLTLAI